MTHLQQVLLGWNIQRWISLALGNITLLVSLQKNFMLPVNLPESLVWVTLDTFFPDLEGMVLPCILHRASATPGSVEQKVSFSLFFGKNPRSTFLSVWIRASVVSKKEKKYVSRSFCIESFVELVPICLGEVELSSLTYRDLILSFCQVIPWVLGL